MLNTTTRHILVTLDGSPRDPEVIAESARLAAELDAEVTLLRVIRPPRPRGGEIPGDLLAPVLLAERETETELVAQAAAFRGRCVETVVLVGARPGDEIVSWLMSHPADLAIMATPVQSRLGRLLSQSVFDTVQRSGLVTILTVAGAARARRPDAWLPRAAGLHAPHPTPHH